MFLNCTSCCQLTLTGLFLFEAISVRSPMHLTAKHHNYVAFQAYSAKEMLVIKFFTAAKIRDRDNLFEIRYQICSKIVLLDSLINRNLVSIHVF